MAADNTMIRIEGGAPFGFRLFGGDGRPLVIAKLRKRSKAWDAGLEEGDVLLSINDQPCRDISHANAMNLIDNAGQFLNLNILRKGGVTDQLNVARATGGSRQRSLTPSIVVPPSALHPYTTTLSPDPPRVHSSQSLQWSSRTTSKAYQPTINLETPQQLRRTIQVQLSEPETGTDDDDTWKRPSKPGFLAKEHSRSLSNSQLPPFSPQSSPYGAPTKSPAVWRPPSYQPQSMEPHTRTSFSQEVIRFNAQPQSNSRESVAWKPLSWQTKPSRTTSSFSEENHVTSTPRLNSNSSKENVAPVVNRGTPSLPTNQIEVAKHKPNVWQPSSTTPARKTYPVPLQGPEFDLSDGDGGGRGGWKQTTKKDDATSADGFGKTPSFQRIPSFQGNPPFQGIPAHVTKILSGNVDDDDDKFGSILHDTEKKQVYVDSSFYHDPAHKYPTVDEQIKMARQVAMSLTAPSNVKARGHRMFMKRKEKSDKWVVDAQGLDLNNRGMSDTEADLYYNPNPTPWNATSSWKTPGGGGVGAAPPPLPTSKLFAPKLNAEDESGERSKSLSAEEFERLRLFSQKTTHNMINPQICFTLAEDLRQSKGKGGRMFAKRREKSEEWTIEGGPSAAPDPKLLQKISGGFTPAATADNPPPSTANNGTRSGVEATPPLNRLKEMIELPKAKITPWDAVAEFGNVDMAFEHLEGISFLKPKVGSPYADSVANSLQQATRRKSDLTSRPTSAAAKGQPVQPPHPSPTWNKPKELTTNNLFGNKMAPHSPGFAEFSPSSYGSGSEYRPVGFQSSSGNAGVSVGFSDL